MNTDRLILRSFEDKDLDCLSLMMTDSETMKHTGFREPQAPNRIKELLAKWKLEGEAPLGVWCCEEKESQEMVGWFMLKKTSTEVPELGYMIKKDHWGKGYASEQCLALLRYAKKLGHVKVIANTDEDNPASIKVLEKIGMRSCTSDKDKVIQFEIYLDQA